MDAVGEFSYQTSNVETSGFWNLIAVALFLFSTSYEPEECVRKKYNGRRDFMALILLWSISCLMLEAVYPCLSLLAILQPLHIIQESINVYENCWMCTLFYFLMCFISGCFHLHWSPVLFVGLQIFTVLVFHYKGYRGVQEIWTNFCSSLAQILPKIWSVFAHIVFYVFSFLFQILSISWPYLVQILSIILSYLVESRPDYSFSVQRRPHFSSSSFQSGSNVQSYSVQRRPKCPKPRLIKIWEKGSFVERCSNGNFYITQCAVEKTVYAYY